MEVVMVMGGVLN